MFSVHGVEWPTDSTQEEERWQQMRESLLGGLKKEDESNDNAQQEGAIVDMPANKTQAPAFKSKKRPRRNTFGFISPEGLSHLEEEGGLRSFVLRHLCRLGSIARRRAWPCSPSQVDCQTGASSSSSRFVKRTTQALVAIAIGDSPCGGGFNRTPDATEIVSSTIGGREQQACAASTSGRIPPTAIDLSHR